MHAAAPASQVSTRNFRRVGSKRRSRLGHKSFGFRLSAVPLEQSDLRNLAVGIEQGQERAFALPACDRLTRSSKALLGRLVAPQIVVVGSYATGLTMKVDRLPHSGETLLGTGYRVDFGGKGSNQAVGCTRLGAQTVFVAKVGTDSLGESALRLYRDEQIDTRHVLRTSNAPTGVGFIIVEAGSGHNCITIDPGANELLTPDEVAQALKTNHEAAVVITQLETSSAVAEAAMSAGRKNGAITILNPAPVRSLSADLLQKIDILTPNESEAKVLAGIAPSESIDATQVAAQLVGMGVKQVVMTLGERGALLVNRDETTHFPGIRVAAVDTTGAGDAFNAGLAVALASGASMGNAIRFAVVTGALAVTKEGVIPSLPHTSDVIDFYAKHALDTPEWISH
jgi:ribokinase